MVGELGKLKRPVSFPEKRKTFHLNLNFKEIQIYGNSDECI